MYTTTMAARIRYGSLARESWKACAVPWKLAVIVPGRRRASAAFWMASTAWPSEAPGARLNDSVTHGNWFW